jgi:hypothetical protein
VRLSGRRSRPGVLDTLDAEDVASGEEHVRYVVLIYHNPESLKVWESLSAEERHAGLAYYAALGDELAASGELVVSHPLAPVEEGRRLPATEGMSLATDGPFAEAKEHLAGFLLLECASFERALEIAARVPEAGLGLVEVRPVRSLADFER